MHEDLARLFTNVTDKLTALISELTLDDPLTWSQEGLDDGCFYCGAWYLRLPVEHEPDCAWWKGSLFLGREIDPEKHVLKPVE